MKPGLQFRLNQQLSLTPQLQQAIRLLQLSQLELEAELRQIAESNPLLEFAEEATDVTATSSDSDSDNEASDENGYLDEPRASDTQHNADDAADWAIEDRLSAEAPIDFSLRDAGSRAVHRNHDDFEPQNAAPETLQEYLLWQFNLSACSPRERTIAMVLIDALNNDGYLIERPEALCEVLPPEWGVSAAEIESVRCAIQRFDPIGVASLDLRDCLRVQLEQFDPKLPSCALALQIVAHELELLAHNNIPKLARKLRVSETQTLAATQLIRNLDPRPGAALDTTPIEYIAPDVYAQRDGHRWRVALNPGLQPRLGLNQYYCNLIAKAHGEDASWMRGQLQEARWLIKSLQSREDTLLKVANAIVQRQSTFLDYGPEAMRPLVLREVAAEVGMHESTISRVTTRKYMHTPRGIFELKHFFSSGVSTEDGGSASATAIQAMLRKLIDTEDTRKPLSDQAIAIELQRKGIQVARRTVAKYREAMRIPSSNDRQRAG